jgi:hypothetical protein
MTKKDILKHEIEINNLDNRCFTLQELYELSNLNLKCEYKDTNSCKASIRANLQKLRDDNYLSFVDKGVYRVNHFKESRYDEDEDEDEGNEDVSDEYEGDGGDGGDGDEDEGNEGEGDVKSKRKPEAPKIGVEIQSILNRRQKGQCRNPNCLYKQIGNFNWFDIPFQNDHRIRVCDGGGNELNNRQLLCPTCHQIKTINEKRPSELSDSEKKELMILQEKYEENEPI